jgi:hypothetical protein
MRVRRETVEHPFATLKMRMGATHCVSAWNKDPVFGVIGIQSGPRH